MNFSSDRRVGEAEKLMMEAAVDWLMQVLDRNTSGIHPNESTLLVEGDDDDPFWSQEQLILIENFPANAFVVMGLIVSIIGIFGLVANGMVLFIFSRFKRLRSPPVNTFIINLAFSDMLSSILHSMAAYSNFNGRWAFGRLGCKLYAMGITCFGLVSILTFSAIACERCLVIGVASSRFKARQMICINSQNSVLRKLRRQTEIRTAQIVVTLILVYLTAWTPYAIVTLIGQFGSKDYQLSPMATAIPAYFAKTAVVLDPLVYGFSHPHFRTSLKNYLSNVCGSRNLKIGSDIRPHNHSGGMSKCSSKSWPGGMPGNSSYQSRGMTVYPTSACCALRICEPHNCTRMNSSAASAVATTGADNGQRRMLRTFRELSLHDVQQHETSFNNKTSNCRRPSAATTMGRHPSIRRNSQQTHQADHHLFRQFKYKVRNAEFHSECCGPSTLVVVGAH
ncbi:melanopsin-like isoform X2 [Daphnia pulex]|uniref:melanopsin-like isoform X2 n=1 Tax=Daphnia pulex TaxID=6669 RepID=UPI001EE05336|nr:melanopsin-like isoform X2 [Daphnia pulex]